MRVRRFFEAFASSASTHFTEQAFRLVFGIALTVYAPSMWQPIVFQVLGWVIAVTAVALCCVPWRWHRRYAVRVIPIVNRYLRFFGLAVASFALLLLAGVFAKASPEQAGSSSTRDAAPLPGTAFHVGRLSKAGERIRTVDIHVGNVTLYR